MTDGGYTDDDCGGYTGLEHMHTRRSSVTHTHTNKQTHSHNTGIICSCPLCGPPQYGLDQDTVPDEEDADGKSVDLDEHEKSRKHVPRSHCKQA